MKNTHSYRLKYLAAFFAGLAIFLFPAKSRAGFYADTAKAKIGVERIKLPLHISIKSDEVYGDIVAAGRFRLSNPTVFLPQYFSIPDSQAKVYDIFSTSLEKINDSIYAFTLITMLKEPAAEKEIVVYLEGVSLAGSDSVCSIFFDSLFVNEEIHPECIGVIVTNAVGVPLPYVRFVTMSDNYPNPVNIGQETTWNYIIDKKSDVKFYLFDNQGKTRLLQEIKQQNIGLQQIKFTPEGFMSAGVYIALLETDSGTQMKHFIIIK